MQIRSRVAACALASSVVLVAASCGGSGAGGSGLLGGYGGNSGNGGSSGSAGTASSGASGGGTLGGSGSGGSSGSGVGTQCNAPGGTRACCGGGTQTCSGGGEFPVWGPCVDAMGAPVTCMDAGSGVGADGGEDSGGPGDGGNGFEDAAVPDYCNNNPLSSEPEILVGYFPKYPQTVGQTGQIKVWVNDENPLCVAPGEQIDGSTGQVTAPGNRTAAAPDGLLWEPSLYLAPQTPQNGGTAHFPQWMKGDINNTNFSGSDCSSNGGGINVPGMDPVPPGANLQEMFTAEFIWDVSVLGLGPGNYVGVFVVHDGDDDRAIGCVNIVVTP